jgi:hypothetical protein
MQNSTALLAWGIANDALTPKVTAEIDLYKTYANQPIQVTVSVTHLNNAAIDPASFLMEGKPIKAEFVKSVKISPNEPLEVAIYHTTLPGQPQGLYILPEISVKVGGKVYQSFQTTYEVTGTEPRAVTDNATLRMNANVEGAQPLYPGLRARFVYRFFFTGNIELKTEVLPLLEAEGFLKIGDKQVKDSVENGVSIQEAYQEVQAVKPGEFKFPASYVEGFAYQEDIFHKRVYQQNKLRAEAPAITVVVAPFPEAGKPLSFNGAIGQFKMDVTLLTGGEVSVDNKVQLRVDISGEGDLSTVLLPDLSTTFNDVFRLSDLPQVGEVKGNTKHFIVDVYPLSTAITEIPSIEFSFFDPSNSRYTTLNSKPIPIKVVPLKSSKSRTSTQAKPISTPKVTPQVIDNTAKKTTPSKETTSHKEPSQNKENFQVKDDSQVDQWQTTLKKPAAIEIEGNYPLTFSNLENLTFGTWNWLWLIPIGIAFLLLQLGLQKYLAQQKNIVKPKSSEEIFQEFLQTPSKTPAFYHLLNKTFLTRLVERGELPSADILPEQLSKDGIQGSVRAFLCEVEQRRFAGKEEGTLDGILREAKALFNQLKG